MGCGTERYADWFLTWTDAGGQRPRYPQLLGGVLREEGLAVPELDKGASGRFWKTSSAGSARIWPLRIWSASSASTGRATAPAFDESPAFPGIPPLF